MRKDPTLEVSSAANKEGHMTQKHSMSARGLAVGYGDRTVIEGLDVDLSLIHISEPTRPY